MFAVQIRTVTYTLALVSAAQMEQEERRYADRLHHYFRSQEDDKYQGACPTGQRALVALH